LIATLSPWITGCYHEVGVSVNAGTPMTGKQVRVKAGAVFSASVLAVDGSRSVLTDVTQMDGVLVSATADSVRLSDVTLWRVDRSQSRGYREAAVLVTRDVSASQIKLEPVRTTLFVTAIVFVGLVIVAMIAMSGLDLGLLSWGADPAQP
jgi:hypothetical protein